MARRTRIDRRDFGSDTDPPSFGDILEEGFRTGLLEEIPAESPLGEKKEESSEGQGTEG